TRRSSDLAVGRKQTQRGRIGIVTAVRLERLDPGAELLWRQFALESGQAEGPEILGHGFFNQGSRFHAKRGRMALPQGCHRNATTRRACCKNPDADEAGRSAAWFRRGIRVRPIDSNLQPLDLSTAWLKKCA